ncbi:MAG TPA: hypothetical protein VHV30_04405 [Polyangiaceae bacterium]|jgi:hypothetical protein|nr:hypothetical protein [Polyangiaceae bacterium]
MRPRAIALVVAPLVLTAHCSRLADAVAEVGGDPIANEPDAGGPDAASDQSAEDASSGGETRGCSDCPADASAVDGAGLCLLNPSFEDATYPEAVPDWVTCTSIASSYTRPTWVNLAASDGTNYVGVMVSANQTPVESQEATLCDPPLRAGVRVPFSVDLTMSSTYGPFGSAFLQLWGGTATCTPEELLWTSPLVAQLDTWKTYCGALTPSKDYPFLILVPSIASGEVDAAPVGGGYLLIDHFGLSGACR